MNLPLTGRVNAKGHLEIGGCDTADLAKKFGTPLYIIDEEDVRQCCRDYKKAFSSYKNVEFAYASKALSVISLIRVIKDEGFSVDVMSGGELFTALKTWIKPQRIIFHGNNKSKRELEEAIWARVGRIVIDNFDEIDLIEKVASKMKRKVNVLLRINPGVEAHTHDAVKTGQTDSKFGISKERALEAVNKILASKYMNFLGLHAHIGSQIFDAQGYIAEIDVLTKLAYYIKTKIGVDIAELNIGGGVGVPYTEADDPISLDAFAAEIIKALKSCLAGYSLKMPKLILEPGRSIIARAGVTVYTVGHVKHITGIRTYVLVDGGMSDNIRPLLYGAKYEFVAASQMEEKKTEKVTIAGKHCESGDVLGKDVMLPHLKGGDLLGVLCTGAYNYSMASNYNRVTRPAMVMVKKKKAKLIVRRETYKDLIRNDVL
jgi:diaminopimelate decarboxylase